VVGQPTFMVLQQKSFCCCVQTVVAAGDVKPMEQSKMPVVAGPESNHNNRGSSRSKLNKQHVVMRHVKSLFGRTASKSPPQPTYL